MMQIFNTVWAYFMKVFIADVLESRCRNKFPMNYFSNIHYFLNSRFGSGGKYLSEITRKRNIWAYYRTFGITSSNLFFVNCSTQNNTDQLSCHHSNKPYTLLWNAMHTHSNCSLQLNTLQISHMPRLQLSRGIFQLHVVLLQIYMLRGNTVL